MALTFASVAAIYPFIRVPSVNIRIHKKHYVNDANVVDFLRDRSHGDFVCPDLRRHHDHHLNIFVFPCDDNDLLSFAMSSFRQPAHRD